MLTAVGVGVAEELDPQLVPHARGHRTHADVPHPDRPEQPLGEHLPVEPPAGEHPAVMAEHRGDGERVGGVVGQVGEHGETVRDARLELHDQRLVHEGVHLRASGENGLGSL